MPDFAGHLVGRRKVGNELQPAVPLGCFQHVTERHGLVVQRAPGRPQWRAGLRVLARCRAMDPVLLHQAGGDFGDDLVAEEGEQMDTETISVAFHIFGVSLSGGEYVVLALELLGGELEGFAVLQLSGAGLALEFEIPILGDVLRLREALLLRRVAMVAAGEKRRALPEAAVLAPVEVQSAAH
jgi:hypothetical protein